MVKDKATVTAIERGFELHECPLVVIMFSDQVVEWQNVCN